MPPISRLSGHHALILCTLLLTLPLISVHGQQSPDGQEGQEPQLLARAKALELTTVAEPPPGDARSYYAAGYAQIMCSAVFITKLPPAFAAHNVGFFTAPFEQRAYLSQPVIDWDHKSVSVSVPQGPTRVARYVGSQGCVTLPLDGRLHYTPTVVTPRPQGKPEPRWPSGERLAPTRLPKSVNAALVKQAVDAAFESAEGMTAALLITYKGQIIAERYAPGIGANTPLESWSMGKSLTATLLGVLLNQHVYELWQKAPIPEWQSAGDPRAEIRIADLLRMSSGLRIRAPYDPEFDANGPYPEHFYLYTSTLDTFHYAATRPLEWPPNTVGRYRNTDPVLINYLIRLAVERRGEDYWSFPQRALFDPLGIRSMVVETDPYGNFLTQGYDLASARDWARLGNLYLQDGVWNGQRLLPEGYVKFVNTLAPAWLKDRRPIYGGFFWINGDGALPVPKDAYYMAGAGGQMTLIIPSHDLVVVRLGHFRGEEVGLRDLNKTFEWLLKAVPATR
jgi:CubicO group peptidase (beta-lactamase class C family)